MRQKVAVALLALLVVASVAATGPRVSAEVEEPARPMILRVYPTSHLPVWNGKQEWRPNLLMELMQIKITPDRWEALGGKATMAPYPHTQSIVITADEEMHDQIVELLNRLAK
ncbi:hypothetical protein [Rhodopirellula halodulae]|uniref:hypothetical protein n=1 Tax=Rhodopirellula halodulae TaxID=2894198 RepID=UPI001E5900F3|nr:hypothetical protein [Rhodopirellula sp. JC737]MCC9655897.1 hypothetical protein [Rhodopirellula sp. JC737]